MVSGINPHQSVFTLLAGMQKIQNQVKTGIERISTGLRINRAQDDPGGLMLSSKLESQVRGLNQAVSSAQLGLHFTTLTSASLDRVITLVQDIRDLVNAAANSNAEDINTRRSFQVQIQDKLDEINSIAEQTQFNNKPVLNGAGFGAIQFLKDSRDFGGDIAFGPNSGNLGAGRSYLNLYRIQEGTQNLKSGEDGVINTGLTFATDIAVTAAAFTGTANPSSSLNTISWNRVSLQNQDVIRFQGVLADGTTAFAGAYTITDNRGVSDLIHSIQTAIDQSESAAQSRNQQYSSSHTAVSWDLNTQRLEFANSTVGASDFNIQFTINSKVGNIKTAFGVERTAGTGQVGTSISESGAKIGNSLTAFTGSTFPTGEYEITTSNVTAAAQREITATTGFFSNISMSLAVSADSKMSDAYLGGIDLNVDDTITINGTDPDGTTFSSTYTITQSDTGSGNGQVSTFQDLLDEMNNRDRSDASFGFNMATAFLTGDGKIQVKDDIADTSQTDLSFTIWHTIPIEPNPEPTETPETDTENGEGNTETPIADADQNQDISTPTEAEETDQTQENPPAEEVIPEPQRVSFTVNSIVNTAGNRETASVSIAGGPAQTVTAGQEVTLQGDYIRTTVKYRPQITLRMGSQLQAGVDKLVVTEDLFGGTLNNGAETQFRNGQKGVIFTSGAAQGGSQFITMDFDKKVNVQIGAEAGGETFILSTTAQDLNFKIGAFNQTGTFLSLPNIHTNKLGSDTDNTLQSIDVTTITGAQNALNVVDDALNQVTQIRSRVGAVAARLEDTIGQIGFSSLSLQNAQEQITNADIAAETLKVAFNTVLMEAQASVLVQANSAAMKIYEILYGID